MLNGTSLKMMFQRYKKKRLLIKASVCVCGAYGSRTRDLLTASQTL